MTRSTHRTLAIVAGAVLTLWPLAAGAQDIYCDVESEVCFEQPAGATPAVAETTITEPALLALPEAAEIPGEPPLTCVFDVQAEDTHCQ